MVTITCLGAAGTVTGSNYLIETETGKQILVDCGLFQGGKKTENRNWEDWEFKPETISTLLLTHAHIDHSGRIPKLVKDGFKGKIITSPPTAELCDIMLLDSAHVQEMDAQWQTKKNSRQGKDPVYPLYNKDDARESLRYLSPIERDRIVQIEQGIKMRLRNAGHILGSSIVELWVEDGTEEIKIVFSGDLGNKNQLIIKDPHDVAEANYLFVESTYGNRLHRSYEDSKLELLEAINYAVSNGEKVIIPAFALERTQEILYLLGEFYRQGQLPEIPVYLDSPLAIKATEIFRKNKKYYDEEARAIVEEGFDPFDMPSLHFTPTTEESIAINQKSGPAIVISANGMCTAGRIKHHLKHNLWRKGASIVIVGYQAEGTTGRKIVEGEKRVRIFREDVAVRAKVFTIGGFSAHADQKGLLDWVNHFKESNPRVFLIHGESVASKTLSQEIKNRLGLETYIPRWKERLVLKPRETIIAAPTEEIPFDTEREAVLATLTTLEAELARIRKNVSESRISHQVGDSELDRLNDIQEELKALVPDS